MSVKQNINGTLVNIAGSGSTIAERVTYDNTESGLTATDVQNAIDEVASDVDSISSSLTQKADKSTVNALPVKVNDRHIYAPSGQDKVEIVNSNASAYVDVNCRDAYVTNGYLKTDKDGMVISNGAGNAYKPLSVGDIKLNGTVSVTNLVTRKDIAVTPSSGLSNANTYCSSVGCLGVIDMYLLASSPFTINPNTVIATLGSNVSMPYNTVILAIAYQNNVGYKHFTVSIDAQTRTIIANVDNAISASQILLNGSFIVNA